MSVVAPQSLPTLLEQLFPVPAHISLSVMRKTGMHVTWHRTAAALQTAAVKAAETGDAYFSFATYNEATTRTLTNLHRVNALVLDIDVGKANSHATLEEARAALAAACTSIRMPAPHVVQSGGGLHCYWPLIKPAPVLAWKAASVVLVTKLMAAGLKADVHPSTNAVGLLRVPGTLNHKYDPPVKVRRVDKGRKDSEGGHKSFDFLKVVERLGVDAVTKELERLRATATPQKVAPATSLPPMVTYGGGASFKATTARTSWEVHDRARLAPILAGCAQMVAAASGPEPLWREGLAVARLCGDGDTTAIVWSKTGGARFDEQATVAKLYLLQDQQGDKGFPTSCATLDQRNPGVCAQCPNRGRVKHPIMLGREVAPAEAPPPVITPLPPAAEVTPAIAATLSGIVSPRFSEEHVAGTPFTPERGFFVNDFNQPCFKGKDSESDADEDTIVPLLDYGIKMLGYAVGKIDGAQNNCVIWELTPLKGRDRAPVEVFLHTKLLSAGAAPKDVLEKFAEYGIIHVEAKAARLFAKFLRVFFSQVKDTIRTSQHCMAFGWQEGTFHTAHAAYTPDHKKSRAFFNGQAHSQLKRMGSLGDGGINRWLEVPRILKRQKRMAVQFAMMLSYASPLVAYSGYQGVLVNLFSRETGAGKTTALEIVNSVWGDPKRLLLSVADTEASTGIIMTAHNSLPVCTDELTNITESAMSTLAYMVTQGKQKNRATKDSNIKDSGEWRLFAVTSSNSSVRDKLGGTKRPDAEAENSRCLEVPMPVYPRSSDDAVVLAAAMRDGQGAAGELYAQWLVANEPQLRGWVNDATTRWSAHMGTAMTERFWTSAVALVEVGFYLSKAAGLHDFDWADMHAYITDTLIPAQRAQVAATVQGTSSADITGDLFLTLQNRVTCFSANGGIIYESPASQVLAGSRTTHADGTSELRLSATAVNAWARANNKPPSMIQTMLKALPEFYALKNARIQGVNVPTNTYIFRYPKPIDQEDTPHGA